MTETLERRLAYRQAASSKAKLVGIAGVAALCDWSINKAHRMVKDPTVRFPEPESFSPL